MEIIKTNFLSDTQIKQIKDLEKLAFEFENLQNSAFLSNEINFDKQFPCFYLGYEKNELIAFLTTFVPTTAEAEILAVTNPKKRCNGYFKQLYFSAKKELLDAGINKVLFVVESNSKSGKEMLKNFNNPPIIRSEYRMVYNLNKINDCGQNITYKKVDFNNKYIFKEMLCSAFSDDDGSDNFIDSVINSQNRAGFIQYINGKPVGTFSINHENDYIFLYGVAITKEQRGKGYGKELVKFAQNIATKSKKKMVLDVDSNNPVAFNLYKSYDFCIDFQVDYYKLPIK